MNEIEVKILDIKPAELRKRLKSAGARKVFEGKIEARFYDFPDQRIGKRGDHLRIRKIGKKVELTYKRLRSKKKYKHNVETDIVVDDFEAAHNFLTLLGLKQAGEYKKKREMYKLKNYQFEIDTYPTIPTFVEVEVKSDSAKTAKKALEKAVKAIGYKMADTRPWNGFEVHQYYKKKLGSKQKTNK